MNILIDMNLSPDWVPVLHNAGFGALHWSSVGPPNASDQTLLAWAAANDHVVFTHDLDFGSLLAASGASGPSVIQIRTQDTLPDTVGTLMIAALHQLQPQLHSGALVVIEQHRSRVRVLPIR